MKQLIIMLAISALLLAGCAGTGAQQAAASPQPGNPAVQPAPAGQQALGGAPGNQQAGAPPAPPSPAVAGSGAGQVKEFTIEATQWQFTPDTITVNKGDIVKITLVNKDVSHGIGIPDFGFDLKAGAGETAAGQFTADKAGTFGFRCNVFCGDGHREMAGTLVVQ